LAGELLLRDGHAAALPGVLFSTARVRVPHRLVGPVAFAVVLCICEPYCHPLPEEYKKEVCGERKSRTPFARLLGAVGSVPRLRIAGIARRSVIVGAVVRTAAIGRRPVLVDRGAVSAGAGIIRNRTTHRARLTAASPCVFVGGMTTRDQSSQPQYCKKSFHNLFSIFSSLLAHKVQSRQRETTGAESVAFRKKRP